MRTTILAALMLLLASLALVPQASAACTYTPLVTVGGNTYPSTGVYLQQGCYASQWGDYGPPALKAGVDLNTIGECVFVPAVFVGTVKVPGTGATYCAPTSAYVPASGLPDIGVAICDGVVGGCSWISSYTLTYYCVTLGVGATVPLPTGDSVHVECTST